MLFLPPSTVQSPDEAAKILSVPALPLAGCTSSPSLSIRQNLSGPLGCKGGVSLHETAELPPFNAILRHPPPFQPTEEEAAGDLLPLGKNSHTCRTLKHRSQCSDLSQHHPAPHWRFDDKSPLAHDVADTEPDTYTLLGAGITNTFS